MLIRIDKYLADCGIGTRSECKSLIKRGAVSINGTTIKDAAVKINPDTDEAAVLGKALSYSRFTYLMLNKPSGVVSAVTDDSQKTVIDLLPEELKRRGLFPVGRLDKDTTGLLILTNDGAFAHNTLSPKRHIDKTYIAEVEGEVGESAIAAFRAGIQLKDHPCKAAELRILGKGEYTLVQVTISEGIYHQIKRMFKAVGCTVISLRRIAFGQITLDTGLREGECRPLNKSELELCREHGYL